MVERCEDPQTHKRAMKSEMQEKGRANQQCFSLRERKFVLDQSDLGKGCETEAMRRVFRFNRKEDETLTGLLHGDGEGSENNLRSDSREHVEGNGKDVRHKAKCRVKKY